jgi:hypothetical protein
VPGRKHRTPAYRQLKARNLAVVTIDGRDHYLGRYNSPESREQYDRLIAEWLANGRRSIATPTSDHLKSSVKPVGLANSGVTVNELILAFVTHPSTYYRRPDGTPTGEFGEYRRTLSLLRDLYGRTSAAAFGPLALKAVREKLVASEWCRGIINQRVDRIKRAFRWAVEQEIVSPTLYQGLGAVRGLQRARSTARETQLSDCRSAGHDTHG